jgi:2-desacetyl-2-hydroxyethyl bacteriochlorophyllide A dehydrogenase
MKAVILEKPGEMRAANLDAPRAPQAGEALVRVHRVGVCGTDLHAFRGTQPYFTYPRIVGHELGVEILALGGDSPGLAVGDLCAVEPSIQCGQCIACRRGRGNCCTELKVLGVHLDGGLREQIVVPVRNLHKSTRLTPEQLAMVEPLSIGSHAVRRAAPEPGDTVLVIGVGPIGLGVAQSLRFHNVKVVVSDLREERLALAQAVLGTRELIDARQDALAQLRRILGGELATVVFDCTGSIASMEESINFMAHGGKLVFVGLVPESFSFSDPLFHRRETTLLSSRNCTAQDFREVIARMETGAIDVSRWITHRASADELPRVFPGWVSGDNRLFKASVAW